MYVGTISTFYYLLPSVPASSILHLPWKECLISLHIVKEEARSDLTPGKIFNPMFRIFNFIELKGIYKIFGRSREFLYFLLGDKDLICAHLAIQMYLPLYFFSQAAQLPCKCTVFFLRFMVPMPIIPFPAHHSGIN